MKTHKSHIRGFLLLLCAAIGQAQSERTFLSADGIVNTDWPIGHNRRISPILSSARLRTDYLA